RRTDTIDVGEGAHVEREREQSRSAAGALIHVRGRSAGHRQLGKTQQTGEPGVEGTVAFNLHTDYWQARAAHTEVLGRRVIAAESVNRASSNDHVAARIVLHDVVGAHPVGIGAVLPNKGAHRVGNIAVRR